MKDDLVPGNLEWADDNKDKVVFVRGAVGNVNMYDGKALSWIKYDEIGQWQEVDHNYIEKYFRKQKGIDITWFGNHMAFWLSIIKKDKAIFSRRLGIKGKIVFGYSIRLRILSKEII